ncbi:MAG: hypothetical protein A2W31_16380 [Planctomycetes bacterium RBG_16_64_10]|nr:MAG: hypothetical protein A2W31_16380 [Planctomycetes bacterium RBG_16_64_10]
MAHLRPNRIMLATTLKRSATPDKTETQIAGIVLRPQEPAGEITLEFEVAQSGTVKFSRIEDMEGYHSD